MARRLRWAQTAADDLRSIHDYIGGGSKRYAQVFVRSIRERAQRIPHMPFQGHIVKEINASELREIAFRGYRLIYLVDEIYIHLVGIIHGARDLNQLWLRENRPRTEGDFHDADEPQGDL